MLTNGSLYSQDAFSVYVHIPFCTRKCPYCHFYVVQDKEPLKDTLLEGLLQEVEFRKEDLQGKKLTSLYFGGGTPILFGPDRIARFIAELSKYVSISQDTEISLEANPENTHKSLLKSYLQAGINRLSIGVQSFNDDELKILGRKHTSDDAKKAIIDSFDIGFRNISLDLMYEVPTQTFTSFQKSLEVTTSLPIQHISLYNLTFEPKTAYFAKQSSLKKYLPDDETASKMYAEALKVLKAHGFSQYEISAFCKDNKYSRHNIGYWIARPFLGFGPSAFSFMHEKRFQNVDNLIRYTKLLSDFKDPVSFIDDVSSNDRQKELLVIALRLRAGIDLAFFEKQYGSLGYETLTLIEKLQKQDLLIKNGSILSLTEKGVFFYDTVATELI